MKNLFKLVSVTILAAFLLTSCGSVAAPQFSVNPNQTDRAIMVNGLGKVKIKPDIAYIYVGVHTERASASEAVAANNASTTNLMEALKANGIAETDMQTSNFSIWQNTPYGPDGLPAGTTYVVDNQVYITVRNLESLGKVLDSAVQAGANNVNSIQFDVADKSGALSEARKEAVKAALAQATELAEAAGVNLGDVARIEYTDGNYSYNYMGYGMGGGGGGEMASSTVPITTGQMEITANVSVTYLIK